ncbi:MAG: STAS domain-containing protein [Solirubrobacteraceae bacterium]
MNVTTRHEASRLVLSLQGELDLSTAPLLEQGLQDVDSVSGITVDLSGLEFMDSTGLRALLLAQEGARDRGQDFSLRRGPPAVQRVFELTRTDTQFSFEQ